MNNSAIVRLTGNVLWLDLVTGDTVDKGRADRVIIRQDGIALDLTAALGTYSMVLKRVGDLKFAGTWTGRSVDGEESGDATCVLEQKDGWLLLSGDWRNDKCQWFARLEEVDAF